MKSSAESANITCPECGSAEILVGTDRLKNRCSSCDHEWGDGDAPEKAQKEEAMATGAIPDIAGGGPKVKKRGYGRPRRSEYVREEIGAKMFRFKLGTGEDFDIEAGDINIALQQFDREMADAELDEIQELSPDGNVQKVYHVKHRRPGRRDIPGVGKRDVEGGYMATRGDVRPGFPDPGEVAEMMLQTTTDIVEGYNDNYNRPNQKERRTNLRMADGTQPPGAIDEEEEDIEDLEKSVENVITEKPPGDQGKVAELQQMDYEDAVKATSGIDQAHGLRVMQLRSDAAQKGVKDKAALIDLAKTMFGEAEDTDVPVRFIEQEVLGVIENIVPSQIAALISEDI